MNCQVIVLVVLRIPTGLKVNNLQVAIVPGNLGGGGRVCTPKDGELHFHVLVHMISYSYLSSEKIAYGLLDKQMDESLYRGIIH